MLKKMLKLTGIGALLLLGTLIGAAGTVALGAGRLWWGQIKSISQQQPTQGQPKGQDPFADLKERLDLYGKRADDVERLLSLLVAVSTIYAIALGINAYAQAKEAESKVEKLTSEMEKRRDEVLRIFPLFDRIDERVNFITDYLLTILPRIDISEKKYDDLKEEQKEAILYYEKSIAATELFNTHSLKEARSGVFHGLGNFYALKYEGGERKEGEARERAIFYLEKAIQVHSQNIAALNDRGYFALAIYTSPNYEEAKKYFEISLKVDSEQQRAYYNLAYIYHMQKCFEKSIEMINNALERAKWQVSKDNARIADIYYHRACSYVSLAKADLKNKRLFSMALDDLEKITGNTSTHWKSIRVAFKADIEEGGDLYPLIGQDERTEKIFKEFRGAT